MSQPPRDDHALMRDLAAGDREALRVLYERHAAFVHRVALRFVGDAEEARDITQSVFVTLLQSAGRYRPRARLSSWIYRIVVNRCLNHRAAASRSRRHPDGERALAQIPDREHERPDRQLERARQRGELERALRRLPERQRLALILARFEGHSYADIAAALGCSKNSVESLIYRARQRLGRELDG